MPYRSTFLACMGSIMLHSAVLATSFYWPSSQNEAPAQRAVQVDLVNYTPQKEVKAKIAQNSTTKLAPKPRVTQKTLVEKKAAAPVKTTILKSAVSPDRAVKPTAKSDLNADTQNVRSGSELLADPQKGKIFLDYFTVIKERVQRRVEKKYEKERLDRGDVALVFVLRSDGDLVKVYAVDKESDANDKVKEFAKQCVKECSPFPKFPKELGMEKISFNLSILFAES